MVDLRKIGKGIFGWLDRTLFLPIRVTIFRFVTRMCYKMAFSVTGRLWDALKAKRIWSRLVSLEWLIYVFTISAICYFAVLGCLH